ncbi:MAG: SCO family protein [Myxococcales bacterium]|nr:SCO family protein [Myxococcales bacterium]
MTRGPDSSDAPQRGPLRRLFMRYPWHISFVLGIILITVQGLRMRHIPEPPPVLFQVPEFSLVDQSGREVTRDSLRGQVWIGSFFFTSCPSICPKITKSMLDLQSRLQSEGVDVKLVSFTVDPDNDTPEVLARYAKTIGADLERWRFVTGPRAQMEQLVVGGFKTAMDPSKRDGDVEMYDIAHSTKLVLVDRDGGVRGYYDTDAQGLDEVFHRSWHVLLEEDR